MKPGSVLSFGDFYDVDAGPGEGGYYQPRADGARWMDVYYVGSEEDLYDLPSNPSRYNG